MRKFFVLAVLVCLFALPLAAHAGYPMKLRDARGKLVTISAKPARIVSLTPSNTEILFALGLGNHVVGVTKYCDYPPAAKKKHKIGDMTANTEAILAVKPDLVIAHAFINDTVIKQLEKLGVTVFAIDPKTINGVARDIRTIGRITSHPKTANKLAGQLESSFKEVKASRAKKHSKKVLVVIQADPLWAAGPKTFVDEMLRTAHAENVAKDARPGFVTFSKELAITRNPDIIIVGSKTDANFFLNSVGWKDTNAARHKHVYVLDNDLIVRPAPRLAEGLHKLAGLLDR
ncbi:MAG: ABC transporter substrate-binding protein [Armatimonadota bacterium]|nr:ABC transporter substrate-binding protein [bacterium]